MKTYESYIYILIILISSFIVLSGCATSSETYLPNGDKGYTINCSGKGNSWDKCYKKAGDICGRKGYKIIDKSDEKGSTLSANQYGIYGGSTENRSILIGCKSSTNNKK